MQSIPLSLYIHIPWCVRKCPYCDFNSHAVKTPIDEAAYVDALVRDLEHDLPLVWGRRVQSIFIGGGTPSLFSGKSIDRLMQQIRARLVVAPDAEITLEANPGAVDETHFRDYRLAGVNRLSIGVQSFDDDKLAALGRIHDARQAVRAFETARKAGFENINLDIMFALPEQSLVQAEADIKQAITLAPEHISAYQLTLEPNTAFHHAPPPLPDDDMQWDMQQRIVETLEHAGFRRYEVSAYAQTGRECRHNRNYWEFGDYLGIGAGAHGKLSEHHQITRLSKLRHPVEYIKNAGQDACISENRTLDEADLITEFLMNALRLRAGFDPALFANTTRLPLFTLQKALAEAQDKGLVEMSGNIVRPTDLGYRYLNELLARIFHEDAE